MTNLTVVVAGVPALATALERTGVFASVLPASSTGELRQIIGSPQLKGVSKSDVVFVFGDTLHEDTKPPLSVLVQKLTAAGWRVLLVALSPKARELSHANPGAGVIPLPLTVNLVLGSIAGFGVPLSPVPDGFDEIDLTGGAASTFLAPAAAPAPAAPMAPATPAFGGSWGAPEAAPAPVIPEPSPAAAPAPASSGWGAPQEAPAPKLGGWSNHTEEPAPATFPAPAKAEPTSGGWGAPPAHEEPAAPALGGWGAPQEAPVVPESSGWGAPPTEEPNRAWAPSPAAPAGNDWGAPTGEPVAAGGWGQEAPAARRTLSEASTEAPAFGGGWGGATQDAPPARRALSGLGGPESDSYEAPFGASLASSAGWAGDGGPVARPGSYQAQGGTSSRKGMVITIAVSKGGTGKSSLTLNLAVFLALRLRGEGKTVCIIDTNFQQADTGKYLNVYHPNIMAVANDPTLLTRERISQALIHKQELNVSALLGPATADDGNPQWITARLYNEILDLLKEQYDYIFIDTPVAEKFHSMFMEFALPRADFIIVPVAPNNATLHNADNWLRQAVTAPRHANGAGVPREKIGVVLNRAKDNIGCSEDDVRANLANWNFLGSIPETDEWQRYNNEYKVVATANYAELDEAFAQVLFTPTQEESLLSSFRQQEASKGGLVAKLRGLLGGRG